MTTLISCHPCNYSFGFEALGTTIQPLVLSLRKSSILEKYGDLSRITEAQMRATTNIPMS